MSASCSRVVVAIGRALTDLEGAVRHGQGGGLDILVLALACFRKSKAWRRGGMIRVVQATRFDGLTEGGRNQPLRIAAEDDGGEEIEVFLKPSGRPEIGIEGMANELLAAVIAGHLALPICEPVLVEISPDWIGAITDPTLRGLLAASCPLAFGSVSAGVGWRKWVSDDAISGPLRTTALGVLAFDTWIENRDRQCANPNLLCKGDAIRIIDHELSFRIRQCLFPRPQPWTVGYMQAMVEPGAHVFGHALRGCRGLDVEPIRLGWSGLSDAALGAYGSVLPPEWNGAAGAWDDAITHLKAVRDRLDDCLNELVRALG